MKGTLLVLALLGIKMAEACPIFYGVFGALDTGSKLLLNINLNLANATEIEKAAVGKIQDCYNEEGITAKILDLILMGSITTSKDCIRYTADILKKNIEKLFKGKDFGR